jgi:peptide chain release factor 1
MNFAALQGWKVDDFSHRHRGRLQVSPRCGPRRFVAEIRSAAPAARTVWTQGASTPRPPPSPCCQKVQEVDVDIENDDLRIETMRKAGSQHVNKTESAIRITHIQTASWS